MGMNLLIKGMNLLIKDMKKRSRKLKIVEI